MAEAEPKYKLPSGYTDVDTFLRDAREDYRVDSEADRANREAAADDLKFACDYRAGPGATHGAQWDDAVVQERNGRPCLTNNVLPQYIGQIVGDNRINRPAIKVRPAEDADEDLAEVRAGIIRYIEAQSNAQWIYTSALQSAATCGIANFRAGLDYADNGSFLRDIRIKPIANPLSVVWDHLSVERTGRDARRCFITDEMPRKDFEKQWPDAIPGDIGLDRDILADNWLTQDNVRVCEYWRMEEDKVTLGLGEDGSTVELEKNADKGAYKETREVSRARACMWLITGFSVLAGPFEVPIDRVPVFRCYGRLFFVGTSRVWFGLTRLMKDVQRLQNYADSVIAETLSLAPKAQWEVDAIAVEGRENEIRESHRNGDPLLIFNTGGERKRVDPPQMPTGFFQWRQLLTQQLKDISGLHDASLGIQSNETSGKAIMARQREGDVATIEYHDNLNASIAECGRVINDLIPIVYDTARQVRIVGEDDAMSVVKINDPNDKDAKDMSQGKFDIVVETGPSYSTKRVEAAESMIAFVQALPAAGAVMGDLLAGAQDWPGAEKIAERLKLLLPPEARQDEEKDPEEMSPEELQAFMQQKQQEQAQQEQEQQITQLGVQLQIEEKKAQIAKLQAETAKIAKEAEMPPDQQEQENPVVILAEVRKANAEADAAEANALKAQAQAREAEAKAALAEQQAEMAHIDRTFNELDTVHKLEHGRGITDPEPTEGAGEAA